MTLFPKNSLLSNIEGKHIFTKVLNINNRMVDWRVHNLKIAISFHTKDKIRENTTDISGYVVHIDH